jgi:hypothetical protein
MLNSKYGKHRKAKCGNGAINTHWAAIKTVTNISGMRKYSIILSSEKKMKQNYTELSFN